MRLGTFGWLRGVDLNHRPLGYEFSHLNDNVTFQRLDAAGNDRKSLERQKCIVIGLELDYCVQRPTKYHRLCLKCTHAVDVLCRCLCLSCTRMLGFTITACEWLRRGKESDTHCDLCADLCERSVTIPFTGETMCVYPRLSFAWSGLAAEDSGAWRDSKVARWIAT